MDRQSRTLKIFAVLFVLLLLAILFFASIGFRIVNNQKNLSLSVKKVDIPLRGAILSQDGFSLAQSYLLYKVSMDTNSLNPNKRDFFINLFSIYSGIDQAKIASKIKKTGYIILTYNINEATARSLRSLNSKFLANDVFIEFTKNGKTHQKIGLIIEISGINRLYPYKDAIEPILGYTQKFENKKLTTPHGIKGIEKYYDLALSPKNDGISLGFRDVGFNIIYDKKTLTKEKIDGSNIILNINLIMQKRIEKVLDSYKAKYQNDEIIAGIMNPKTGAIIALASSNRFNPKNIIDPNMLNSSAIERAFEPGSTIKPMIFSLLLDKGLINPLSPINLEHGKIKIGSNIFRDDTPPPKNAITQDVIIRSSNVGMIKLSRKLSGLEMHEGLASFGFGAPSEIDLPYEKRGIIPSAQKLTSEIYKASASFGYGLSTTFVQILRAYGAFANDGRITTPHIANKIITSQKTLIPKVNEIQVISPESSRKMREILIKAVESGTGKRAQTEGFIIGGKTGTARKITVGSGYSDNSYNGSFFGFASKNSKEFVIGVVSFGNKDKDDYYGSRSAAPIFKEIVKILDDERFYQ